MIIKVGSKNPQKLTAIREVLDFYELFKGCEIIGLDVDSGVNKQPIGFKETLMGARNRAIKSFDGCEYSVGLESGLFILEKVIDLNFVYVDFPACVIYDGKNVFYGLGPGFMVPNELNIYIKEGLDLNEASKKSGLTQDSNVGSSEGLVGILTKGVFPRVEQLKPSIHAAIASMYKK